MNSTSVPSVFLKRKLDQASTASVDVGNLNSLIVKMRPKVHAAKLVVIQKLRDRIGKLRKMKGSDQKKVLNEKKAVERGKEIEVIKALGKDHISKYAIGSTANLQTVCAKPGVSLEEIALVRLASHQYIQKMVQEFRGKHPDWKELGAFLMTKQTNREFKRKKKKPDKITPQMKQLNKKKAKVRIEASETMVKSYLNQKLKDEGIASDSEVVEESDYEKKDEANLPREKDGENDSDSDDNNFEDSNGEGSENEEESEEANNDSNESEEGKSVNASDFEGDEGHIGHDNSDDDVDDDEFRDIELGSNSDTDASDHGDSDGYISDEGDSFSVSEHKSELSVMSRKEKLENRTEIKKENKDFQRKDTKSRSKDKAKNDVLISKDKKKKVAKNKNIAKSDKCILDKDSGDSKNDTLDRKKAKLKSFEKVQGEVIVKKLNLDEWCNSETNETDIGKVVLGLTDNSDKSVKSVDVNEKKKVKKKILDPFFDTGERLFQSRDSEKGELGKNLLAFAGYTGDTTQNDQNHDNDDELNNVNPMNEDNAVVQFNDYDDVFHEKSRRDGSVYRKANEIGKEAFRTTFMESLNGEEEFFKKKHFRKDKHNDRFRDRHREEGEFDYNKKKGLSAGTKAKFKKKGINPTRDSKQEELGSSLLAIAGYQTGGAGSEAKIENKQASLETKADSFKLDQKSASKHNEKKNPTIHPSWEASLKRKQQQTAKIEFTGKKIKFDDD